MPQDQQTYTPKEGDPVIDHNQENELSTPEISIENDASATLEVPSEQAQDETPKDAQQTPVPQEGQQNDGTPQDDTPAPTPGDEAAFKAEFKYKVRDEEFEMDDWVKESVKDEETYKKVQDLYTRGHGLEIAKRERDDFKNKFQGLESGINYLNGLVQNYYKDPTNPEHARSVAEEFISSLKLPKQMFMQYAISELKHQQLAPEERARIDAQRQQQAQVQQFQTQTQTLEQQNKQMQVDHYNQLLEMALVDPNVSGVAADYEARIGRPGAFREFVIQRGIFHEQTSGKIVSPVDLAKEAVQMLGITPQGTATQTGNVGTQQIQTQPQQQPQTLTAQQLAAQQQKQVLPNISGQGTASPVKKTYSSIDQIRERYNQISS